MNSIENLELPIQPLGNGKVRMTKGNFHDMIQRKNPKNIIAQYIIDEVTVKNSNFIAFWVGKPGCLSGDSYIRYNRSELGRGCNIKYMYNQFHNNPDKLKRFRQWDLNIPTFVRSFTGKSIRLHRVDDVIYSGKKETFLLELQDGKNIKATIDHKIMTQNGWKELGKLDIGTDLVMCDTPNSSSNKTGLKYKAMDTYFYRLNYHPFGGKRKRVVLHVLLYESKLNNMNFQEYIETLMNDPLKSKTFQFVNSSEFVVHHKDNNHYNNSIENLQLLTYDAHLTLHSKEHYLNFNQGIPFFIRIKRICSMGIEDTYDIVCAEPYHNFNANEIIVHNCGKSLGALKLCEVISRELGHEFDINDCVFGIQDLLQKVVDIQEAFQRGENVQGKCVLYDEAGISMDNRQWHESTHKALNDCLETFRFLNIVLMITVPGRANVDSKMRALAHAIFNPIAKKVDHTLVKPLLLKENIVMDIEYKKYLQIRHAGWRMKVRTMKVYLPEIKLRNAYDRKMKEFKFGINVSSLRKMKPIDEKKNVELPRLSERQEKIYRMKKVGLANNEIAHQLMITPTSVSVHLRNIRGKGYEV